MPGYFRRSGPRVGAVDAPWVRGLLTERAHIPIVEACGRGQRGRHSSKQRAGVLTHPRAQPTQGSSPGGRGSLGVWKVHPLAEPAHSSLHCIHQTGVNEGHLLLSHPQRCGQIVRVAALLLFVKQALLLREGRGACGGSRARITLIKALFPQRSRAQIRVNPNKIRSRRNGTL